MLQNSSTFQSYPGVLNRIMRNKVSVVTLQKEKRQVMGGALFSDSSSDYLDEVDVDLIQPDLSYYLQISL
jgi:hypothetical protein